jgi:predicted phage-related endonuclease
MITESIKRILRKIRSDKILNEIESGKIVYFENPLEEIAFKCIHRGIGKLSKYYAKHYGRGEYEIDFDSSYVIMAVMEGKPISKTRYDRYHLIEGVFWNRDVKIPARTRQWVISG